ncbi:VWA domain-containing protein [Actinosynnema sp. NPDC023794]
MGIGRLDGGRFNLIVSVRHNADGVRLGEWRASFERASALLFDATDGQHQFGTIYVCNNSSGGRNADAWLLDADGRSSSSVRGLGRETARMNLSGDERFKPFVIIHEFGHYGYGMRDEYEDVNGSAAECIGGTTSDACVMEAAWNEGDRFGNRATGGALVTGRVSEFCVPGNHDPDRDTEQHDINGESCWQTMVGAFPGLTMPGGTPTGPAPGGATPINWVVLAPEQRLVLVIDRSGSMAGNKLSEAKFGADWWADSATAGDRLCVVSFAHDARTDFALTPITTQSDRDNAQNAIAALAAGGSTSIGGGLGAGLTNIINAGTRAATQVVVLLTDGLHNSGEHPTAVVPDLVANGVRVYTLGIGRSIDTALLQSIANSTGGTFYRIDPNLSVAAQEFSIRTALMEISGIARDDGGVVTTQPENVDQSGAVELPVHVESGSELATFGVTWQGTKGRLLLELTDPNGETIKVGTFPETTRQILGDRPYMAFQVGSPTAGEWRVRILPEDHEGSGASRFFAFSQHPKIDGGMYTPQDRYNPGDVVPLFLQVYFGQPITGLSVSGIATLPDGGTAPLRFDDGGDQAFGDLVAEDGTYSALFDETHGDPGTYTFEVEVESDGTSAWYPERGEQLLPGESYTLDPIPAFRRQFSLSLVIGEEPIEKVEDDV